MNLLPLYDVNFILVIILFSISAIAQVLYLITTKRKHWYWYIKLIYAIVSCFWIFAIIILYKTTEPTLLRVQGSLVGVVFNSLFIVSGGVWAAGAMFSLLSRNFKNE